MLFKKKGHFSFTSLTPLGRFHAFLLAMISPKPLADYQKSSWSKGGHLSITKLMLSKGKRFPHHTAHHSFSRTWHQQHSLGIPQVGYPNAVIIRMLQNAHCCTATNLQWNVLLILQRCFGNVWNCEGKKVSSWAFEGEETLQVGWIAGMPFQISTVCCWKQQFWQNFFPTIFQAVHPVKIASPNPFGPSQRHET